MAEEKKSENTKSKKARHKPPKVEPPKKAKPPKVESSVNEPVGATDTMLNGQITDAVTQTNVKILGEASAVAMANLYQSTAQALANAAHNATMTQQQMNILAQTATAQGINLIYGINSANSSKIDTTSTDIAEQMAELKVLIESAHKVIKKAKSKKKQVSKK